jgi:hypothetical protein
MSKRSKKEIVDIINKKETIDSLGQEIHFIHGLLIDVGMDYTNKIQGNISNHDIFKLRDKILYRLRSIQFHYSLILNIYDYWSVELNRRDRPEGPRDMIIWNRSSDELYSLFDSLIFHTVSLFDYIANMIDYICLGKKQRNLKWPNVVKSARDRNNSFSNTDIAKHIIKINVEWLDKFYKHRSEVIHHKIDLGGTTLTHNLMQGQRDMKHYAPKGFIDYFIPLKNKNKECDYTLQYVGYILIKETIQTTKLIMRLIKDYIENNRTVKKREEIFRYAPSRKK